MFNKLTHRREYVGNRDGVTVDERKGKLIGHDPIRVTDLPGVYSLSPISPEESVTVSFLKNKKADVIVNVLDISQLHKELYLSLELRALDTPMILVLNKGDLVEGETQETQDISGVRKALAEALGIPVLSAPISKKDIPSFRNELVEAIQGLPDEIHSPELYREWRVRTEDFLRRLYPPDTESVEDRESILIEARHAFIDRLMDQLTHSFPHLKSTHTLTRRIDRIVLNRFLAFPLFILILWGIYYIAISSIGGALIDLINEDFFNGFLKGLLVSLMNTLSVSPDIQSFITESALAGPGLLLSFAPQLFILFALLTALEESGYFARVAFITDRLLKPFGLSGRSVIPFLIGSGCSVPGITAARTIHNIGEQKRTIILTPFIPCSAKLPVIVFIAAIFFPTDSWVIPSLFIIGISVILAASLFLKTLRLYPEQDSTLVISLPQYGLPSLLHVLQTAYVKTKSFVLKAGIVILPGCILIALLNQFNIRFESVSPEESMLSSLGSFLAPIFAPLGFDNTPATVSTFTGFIAKENIIATLGMLVTQGASPDDPSPYTALLSPLGAYAFLVFNVLCAPCVAAIATMLKELGHAKETLLALAFQTGVAYLVALIVYQSGLILDEHVFATVLGFLVLLWFFLALGFQLTKKRNAFSSEPSSSREESYPLDYTFPDSTNSAIQPSSCDSCPLQSTCSAPSNPSSSSPNSKSDLPLPK